MRKKFVTFLLIALIALSFSAVPVSASSSSDTLSINATTVVEMSPHSEMTQTHWRMSGGVLQFRVWGVTSARWLTPWTNF